MSKEFKTYSMDIAGKTLRVDIGRVAAQANGAAFMHYGDTTVLSTITASEKPRDGIDFFPLRIFTWDLARWICIRGMCSPIL